MRNAQALILLLALAGAGHGCASAKDRPGIAERVAQCSVCAHNNDLACETVVVGSATPSVKRKGTTYYFCSERCRDAFLEDSETYVDE